MATRAFTDSQLDSEIIDSTEGTIQTQAECTEIETQTTSELLPEYQEKNINADGCDFQTQQTQTQMMISQANVDSSQVIKFLQYAVPLAIKELTPTQAYQFLEQRVTSNELEPTIQYSTASNQQISCMSCNCTGSSIAVGLVEPNHYGFCRHSTQIHFVSLLSSAANHTLSLNSCVTSIKYHPVYPSILAVGQHTGEITIFQSDQQWVHSELGETHTCPVVALDWVKENQIVTFLVSASTEGLICVWDLGSRDHLTQTFKKCNRFQLLESDGIISCMTVVQGSSTAFVGLGNGQILQISLPTSDPSRMSRDRIYYPDHVGLITSISLFPGTSGLIASSGTDESFVVRNTTSKDPILILQLFGEPILDLEWSPHSPSVVAVCSSTQVAIMDFTENKTRPVSVYSVQNACKVCWNKQDSSMIVVGCTDGKVIGLSASGGVFDKKPLSARLMAEWETARDASRFT